MKKFIIINGKEVRTINAENMKYHEIPQKIESLKNRLEFDGEPNDPRLHSTETVNFFEEKESDYEAIEKDIDTFVIERDKYTMYGSYDVSGWNYWVNQQEEPNYITVGITFKEEDLTPAEIKQLEQDLDRAEEHFSEHQMNSEKYVELLTK